MYRSRTEARRPSASAMVLTSSGSETPFRSHCANASADVRRFARVVVVVVRVVRVVVFVVAPAPPPPPPDPSESRSRIVPVVSPVGARRERRRRPVRLILPGGIFFGFRAASRRPRLARRRRLARGRDRARRRRRDAHAGGHARVSRGRRARVSGLREQSTARLASVDRARSRRRPRAVVARRPGAIAITSRAMISPSRRAGDGRHDRSRHRARHGPRRDRAETRVHAARGRVLAGGGGSGRKSDIKRLPAHTSRHDAIVRAKFALKPVKAVEFHRRERAEVRSGIPIRHDLIGEEKHFRTKRTNKTGKGKTKWLACLLPWRAHRAAHPYASARPPGQARPDRPWCVSREMARRPRDPVPGSPTRHAPRASRVDALLSSPLPRTPRLGTSRRADRASR